MGKNVAVFVDVANIFYAAKAAGVDIDYVTLLKSATAGRDFVRAYAYTGLDPDNENQRNFHSFLARNSYKVVSKDIRKYGDGKVKANLDIELVVDMMKTARNLDVAIVVSGDGDFAPAIRAVQEMGVRVEVISFRGNTSSDLIEVADLFTDITQLARVEKGSSRSGRRVAGDDEDLSMTEVPDKQTEGTGTQRGRGRGRGRGRPGEAEPVVARGRTTEAATREPVGRAAAAASAAGLTVLPGEKLSRVAPAGIEPAAVDDEAVEPADTAADTGEAPGAEGDEARRRRRRRGGRGRGRGRGQQEAGLVPGSVDPEADTDVDVGIDAEEEEAPEIAAAPRSPRPTPFGSFWDSQLGVTSSKVSATPSIPDDEDFDEPEIPEYLIAEQRRGQQGRGQQGRGAPQGRGGPRGGRAAYTAAIDRERYGRGGGGGGINRYPDVSGRDRGGQGGRPAEGGGYPRQDRPERQDRPDRPSAPRSSEPWSEVPEELEAMLRAQLAGSPKSAPRPQRGTAAQRGAGDAAPAVEPLATADVAPAAAAPKRRTTTRGKTSVEPAGATTDGEAITGDAAATAAPKRRTATRRKTATAADEPQASEFAAAASATGEDVTTPKRRTTRSRAKAPVDETPATVGDAVSDAGAVAPKRRATRKKADPA